MTNRHRPQLLLLVLGAAAASQAVEVFINRVIRPDAAEITWISDLILACGFLVGAWLWLQLHETRQALSDLEHQRVLDEVQLTIAAKVQTSLLPAVPKPHAGVSWYAAVEPAYKVGGDYYDFLPLADGKMCVVLADVSGKGVPAAVFLANLRGVLHTLARGVTRPRPLVSSLSAALVADSESGLYATCIVAIVDPVARSMVYVNAGHPAGVIWNRRAVRRLVVGGPPVGLLAEAQFEEEELSFGEGDLVAFVSDGVTEAFDASGDEAVTAIATQIADAEQSTPEGVGARLLTAARQAPGPCGVEDWMDDRTAVVFGLAS
jgi:serine phosphatase RsbU (regulator of sigma subunit)